MNTKMKAAQISQPGGDWEQMEREIPEPAAEQVRVKVEACGICRSDALVKDGLQAGIQYPRRVMRSPAASMRLEAASRAGDEVNGWVWAGMAGIASAAILAGAAISQCASIARSRGSISTAGTPSR